MGGATLIDTVARHAADPAGTAAKLTLIPYHLWANRGVGEMTTWLLTDDYAVGDVGPAGGLIFYRNPHVARDGWRYLEAMPFDQSQGATWGCFRREIEGARRSEEPTSALQSLMRISYAVFCLKTKTT